MNGKIKLYNHNLKEMCKNLPTSTPYINVNVFREPNGALKENLSKGPGDPLHLNEQGVKLFASRFKHALRAQHNLPSFVRKNSTTWARITSEHTRGGSRGGSVVRGNPRGRESGLQQGSLCLVICTVALAVILKLHDVWL